MDIQQGKQHGLATWTIGHAAWTSSMDMEDGDRNMQHGHGHVTWTCSRTCSLDMDVQHGYEIQHVHAVWTWTCSIDMDTQHENKILKQNRTKN
jgi:hypothetical protein